VIDPEAGLAAASMCGTWKTVELALGWQIASLPLAGAGQAAEAVSGAQSAAARVKLAVKRCRDGYFMAIGALGEPEFVLQSWQYGSNLKAKLLLSEIHRRSRAKMQQKIKDENADAQPE
jgi:hypothetical protein